MCWDDVVPEVLVQHVDVCPGPVTYGDLVVVEEILPWVMEHLGRVQHLRPISPTYLVTK